MYWLHVTYFKHSHAYLKQLLGLQFYNHGLTQQHNDNPFHSYPPKKMMYYRNSFCGIYQQQSKVNEMANITYNHPHSIAFIKLCIDPHLVVNSLLAPLISVKYKHKQAQRIHELTLLRTLPESFLLGHTVHLLHRTGKPSQPPSPWEGCRKCERRCRS